VLLPKKSACQYQIGETKQREQLLGVLGQPAIPRFAMMKQALQHMKRMLNLGAHAGLGLFQLLLQSARAILLERLAQSLHGKPARFEPQFRSPFTFSQWRTGLLA
jgi:hypothetical protein